MTWYSLLKYIHVLLAITAVGSNITYAVWNARAAAEPAHAAFALKGISFIDRRVANPAYALLLITGLVLVIISPTWGLGNGWIASALILFALLIVVAVGFFSRVAKRQIQTLETQGQASPTYHRLTQQAQIYGIASMLIVFAIVFMMVVKPF
jgi:uncharacterized membrane protein